VAVEDCWRRMADSDTKSPMGMSSGDPVKPSSLGDKTVGATPNLSKSVMDKPDTNKDSAQVDKKAQDEIDKVVGKVIPTPSPTKPKLGLEPTKSTIGASLTDKSLPEVKPVTSKPLSGGKPISKPLSLSSKPSATSPASKPLGGSIPKAALGKPTIKPTIPIPDKGASKPLEPPGPQPKPLSQTEKEKLEDKAEEVLDELEKEDEKLDKQRKEKGVEIPPLGTPKKKSNKKKIVGLIIVLLMVVGVGAGIYLASRPQDIRQQASDYPTPTPMADSAGGTWWESGSEAECMSSGGTMYCADCGYCFSFVDGHGCNHACGMTGAESCNFYNCTDEIDPGQGCQDNPESWADENNPPSCDDGYCGWIQTDCPNGFTSDYCGPCAADSGDSDSDTADSDSDTADSDSDTADSDSDTADSDSDSDTGDQELVCTSLNANNQLGWDPQIGDTLEFICNARATGLTISEYHFRYYIDGDEAGAIRFDAADLGNTSSFTVAQDGDYRIQCQACAGTTCTPWDPAVQ